MMCHPFERLLRGTCGTSWYREAIDNQASREQTIAVRWILRVFRAIPLTPCWVRARRRRNRREMRELLRRYYAGGQ